MEVDLIELLSSRAVEDTARALDALASAGTDSYAAAVMALAWSLGVAIQRNLLVVAASDGDGALQQNRLAWVELLRLITDDIDRFDIQATRRRMALPLVNSSRRVQ